MGQQDRPQRNLISAVAGAIAHVAFGEDANPDVFKWIESLPSRSNDGSGAKEFFTQALSDLEQGRAHLYPFITSFEFCEFLSSEANSGSSETPAQQAQHRITALIASEKRRLENPLPIIREAARAVLKRRSGADAVMQRRAPRIQLAIKQLRTDSERGIATSCKKPMRPTIAEMRAGHAKREAEYQAGWYDSEAAIRKRAQESERQLSEHLQATEIKLPPALDDDWEGAFRRRAQELDERRLELLRTGNSDLKVSPTLDDSDNSEAALKGRATNRSERRLEPLQTTSFDLPKLPPALDDSDDSEAALERRAMIHGNRLENLLTLASDDALDNSGYELGLGISAQWGKGHRSRKGRYIP